MSPITNWGHVRSTLSMRSTGIFSSLALREIFRCSVLKLFQVSLDLKPPLDLSQFVATHRALYLSCGVTNRKSKHLYAALGWFGGEPSGPLVWPHTFLYPGAAGINWWKWLPSTVMMERPDGKHEAAGRIAVGVEVSLGVNRDFS